MNKLYPEGTAASQGLIACHVCANLNSNAVSQCQLCGRRVFSRKPQSIQRTLALLFTACILYIPANVLPIMETIQLGRQTSSTIVGGAITLWEHGSYPIAIIILIASVVVPVLKISAVFSLCWMVANKRQYPLSQLHKVYGYAELIGKWSMVDIFVVALLVALVQLGNLMSIRPGPGALAFSGVVMFTMLAARAFDPRLIWDKEVFDLPPTAIKDELKAEIDLESEVELEADVSSTDQSDTAADELASITNKLIHK